MFVKWDTEVNKCGGNRQTGNKTRSMVWGSDDEQLRERTCCWLGQSQELETGASGRQYVK